MNQSPLAISTTGSVGVLTALAAELEPVAGHLGLKPQGRWLVGDVGRHRVIAAATGVGGQAALRRFGELVHEHQPGWLIIAGYAGGLDPALHAGDVVNVGWVLNGAGDVVRLHGHAATIERDNPSARNPTHSLVTVPTLVTTPAAKQQLHRRHHAALVDLETYPLAAHAAQQKLPVTVLRAVSDPADMALPGEAVSWVTPDGATDAAATATYLARHPLFLRTLLKLRQHTQLAGQRLADRIHAAIVV